MMSPQNPKHVEEKSPDREEEGVEQLRHYSHYQDKHISVELEENEVQQRPI